METLSSFGAISFFSIFHEAARSSHAMKWVAEAVFGFLFLFLVHQWLRSLCRKTQNAHPPPEAEMNPVHREAQA